MDDDVRLAEQALVAALVLEPHRLGEVAGLSTAEFSSPACRLVFAALRRLHDADGPIDPGVVLDELRSGGQLRSDGYPVSGLMRWFDDVPVPAALSSYARLVADAAVCRRVESSGLRLVQVASRPEPSRALLAAASQRTLLAAELRRFADVAAGSATADGSPAPSSSGLALADGSHVGAGVAVDEDVAHAELVTVGSLLWAPALSCRLSRWLTPADFAVAEHAVVFGRISSMVRDGVPVDRVTVRDQLRRRGELPDAVAGELLGRAEASVPVPASAPFYARQVLAASVVRQVGSVGEALIGWGRERRGGAPVVLRQAVAALDRLAPLRSRVRRSRGSAPPAPRSGAVRRAATVVRRPSTPVAERG